MVALYFGQMYCTIVTVPIASYFAGHCYSGQHTTDKESVDYRVEKGAAKSCEENGCVEFYV